TPVVGDSGIVRSEQLIDEKYLGTGTVPEIGVPGTTSNIPGYKGLAEGNAEYNRTEETRNYEISRRLDKTQKNQGDIRMMSVAVMLNDEGIKYGEETYLTRRRIMEIRENVISAANLNEQRGDKVSVVPIRFMPGEPGPKDEYIFNQKMETVKYWTRVGLIIFLILLTLVISLLAMRTWVVREELPQEPEFEEEVLEEPVPVEELLAPELSDEQRMREKIKEEVLRMIHDDPEGAALIVRSWLFQDTD
nr:flagellar M-ring protein FliF C-terminal domain-containing protein [bacterium]